MRISRPFGETRNVRAFVATVEAVRNARAGMDRMALIYGLPGLGKSETALWYCNRFPDTVLVVITPQTSARWMLEEMVGGMNIAPARTIKDLYTQVIDAVLERPRVFLIDEVDHLTNSTATLETLRSLHDRSRGAAAMIFIGMEHADKKLYRHSHLWRRFTKIMQFQPLEREDVKSVVDEVSAVRVADDVIDNIIEQILAKNNNGVTVHLLYPRIDDIEKFARKQRLDFVRLEDLPERLRDGRAG